MLTCDSRRLTAKPASDNQHNPPAGVVPAGITVRNEAMVRYEWDIETVEHFPAGVIKHAPEGAADVVNHNHFRTLRDVAEWFSDYGFAPGVEDMDSRATRRSYAVVLVKDCASGRCWAYADAAGIATFFDGDEGDKVPVRFLLEWEQHGAGIVDGLFRRPEETVSVTVAGQSWYVWQREDPHFEFDDPEWQDINRGATWRKRGRGHQVEVSGRRATLNDIADAMRDMGESYVDFMESEGRAAGRALIAGAGRIVEQLDQEHEGDE